MLALRQRCVAPACWVLVPKHVCMGGGVESLAAVKLGLGGSVWP